MVAPNQCIGAFGAPQYGRHMGCSIMALIRVSARRISMSVGRIAAEGL
jgi:hypothetical protein